MKLNQCAVLALALLVVGTGVRAESELDGPKSIAPSLILSELNTETQTVTQFKVEADASVSPEALQGLSDTERKDRIEAFVKNAIRPENKISEEKVEKVASELDSDGSTAAWGWRWRGCYSGGYYGRAYYGYYGGYRAYYRPAWNYGVAYGGAYGVAYGGVYGGGYYAGYYGGGYYGGGYNNCYYTLYNNAGYGW